MGLVILVAKKKTLLLAQHSSTGYLSTADSCPTNKTARKLYNWKPVFGDKITWTQYREGFGGSKGVKATKEQGGVTRASDPQPLQKKKAVKVIPLPYPGSGVLLRFLFCFLQICSWGEHVLTSQSQEPQKKESGATSSS